MTRVSHVGTPCLCDRPRSPRLPWLMIPNVTSHVVAGIAHVRNPSPSPSSLPPHGHGDGALLSLAVNGAPAYSPNSFPPSSRLQPGIFLSSDRIINLFVILLSSEHLSRCVCRTVVKAQPLELERLGSEPWPFCSQLPRF